MDDITNIAVALIALLETKRKFRASFKQVFASFTQVLS